MDYVNYTGKRVCLSNRQVLEGVVMCADGCQVVKVPKPMFHDLEDWPIGRKKAKYLSLRPGQAKKTRRNSRFCVNRAKLQVVKAYNTGIYDRRALMTGRET